MIRIMYLIFSTSIDLYVIHIGLLLVSLLVWIVLLERVRAVLNIFTQTQLVFLFRLMNWIRHICQGWVSIMSIDRIPILLSVRRLSLKVLMK